MSKQGHPKGLYLLFVTEMAERFSYYGMRAVFTLYMVAALFTMDAASEIYGYYTGLVYLTPLLGGYIADRYWGNRRSIIVGGLLMALGQFYHEASHWISIPLVRLSLYRFWCQGGRTRHESQHDMAHRTVLHSHARRTEPVPYRLILSQQTVAQALSQPHDGYLVHVHSHQ